MKNYILTNILKLIPQPLTVQQCCIDDWPRLVLELFYVQRYLPSININVVETCSVSHGGKFNP